MNPIEWARDWMKGMRNFIPPAPPSPEEVEARNREAAWRIAMAVDGNPWRPAPPRSSTDADLEKTLERIRRHKFR